MSDDAGSVDGVDVERDKALRLLRYLQEYVKLRMKVVRSVDQYGRDGFVGWYGEMPQSDGCASHLWTEMGDGKDRIWLEVRKQTLPRCPELPPLLEPWVEAKALTNSDGEPPELRKEAYFFAEVEKEDDGDVYADDQPALEAHRIEDHPDVPIAWEAYLAEWRPWAEEHSRRSKIQRLYGELFRAYQLQRRLGESYEFVVGLGLLCWRTPQNQDARRHVLVAQAELKFDDRRGVMTVECPPPPDGARLQIEDEFLEPSERPQKAHYEALEAQLSEIGDGIWSEEMRVAVRSWGTALHPDTEYSEGLSYEAKCDSTPRLAFAPGLILRRRTARGMLAAYKKIIEQLEGGGRVPFGFRRLTGHYEDDWISEPSEMPTSERSASATGPGEVHFPLPSNDEQRRILETLGRRQGVLVQGPPGTGKSHTIANLICHYLALGKRVLVTSETPRALRVLKGKLPDEIVPLCVSLLGADTASFSELENSISGISLRQSNWDSVGHQRSIERLESELEQAKASRARLEREIREIRESETHSVSVAGGYEGTAAAIGRRINDERASYGWLVVNEDAPDEPPLSSEQALFLLHTLRRIPRERAGELQQSFIGSQGLPSVDKLSELVRAEEEAARSSSDHKRWWSDPAFDALVGSSEQRCAQLQEVLRSFLVKRNQVEARTEPWASSALPQILSESEAVWSTLAERTREGLDGLREAAAAADGHKVRVVGGHDRMKLLSDAKDMVEHLRAGGRWSLLGIPVGPARGKTYLRKDVQVDGRQANSIEALTSLINRLGTEDRIQRLWAAWRGFAEKRSAGLETQVAELEEHLEVLDRSFEALELARASKPLFEQVPHIAEPDWSSQRPEELLRIAEAVDAKLREHSAREQTERALADLKTAIAAHDAHGVNGALCNALKNRDLKAWAEQRRYLVELEADFRDWREAEGLRKTLHSAVPAIADAVAREPTRPEWDDRFRAFQKGWAWAIAERWVKHRNDRRYQQRLQRKMEELHVLVGKLASELAAERAWSVFLRRLKPAERENLEAWQVAVKRIGKGTGKHAERYRAAARAYMGNCIHAIPAWVVPRYRVAEVLEPQPELFDVVIVDEASQTGVDGLFLYYLGKQVIVVGDHEQISPSGIGVPEAALAELQNRLLDDVPFRVVLGATNSLYQHAKIRFPGTVVLREHFRCMPEIIQFSNDLCYAPNGTPLVPLRTYPPNRLQPVLTQFVSEGYQQGRASSAVNPMEARALVAQLAACLNDNRYEGMSFGVISLLGETQARLIQQLLTELVGPAAMEERSLVCGDAYAFQGDERDVMFLSMVSAPNARIGALTIDAAKQRFNVAASRAKDQLWLFHSAKPEDLSAQCMRRKILEYCLNPRRDPGLAEGDEFESEFERHVCERIRDRGFHVRTQVPCGEQTSHRYRIDLVVEGIENRLAVECDGDRWHGPEEYEQDMARQRQLERAGWRFFRISGGSFYADPEDSLEPLWEELERMGIRPGADEVVTVSPPTPVQEIPAPDVEIGPHETDPVETAVDEAEKGDPSVGQDLSEDGELSREGQGIVPSTAETEPANSNRESDVAEPATSKLSTGSDTTGANSHEVHSKNKATDAQVTKSPHTTVEHRKGLGPDTTASDKAYVDGIPAEEWFVLARWAKQHDKLEAWQRSLVYTIGRNKQQRWELTVRQRRQGVRAHRLALEAGFDPPKSGQNDLF